MKNNKFITLLTLVSAFIYLVVVSLQGFDLCDEGFCLSFYQQFFSNPETVEYQFLFYLTGMFGGFWNEVFGWGGIFSFRLFNIFVILSTAYITYKTVEDYVSPNIFLIATFCVILLNTFGNMVFHHNYFTSLLVAIALLFLLQGIDNNKKGALFFGGFFIGLSFFARIPNFTMLSLGLLFIINLLYNKDWSLFWKSIIICVIGCLTGVLVIIVSMYLMGHLSIFINTIKENLFSLGTEQGSNHNLKTLLFAYISNYRGVFKFLILYFFLFSGFIYAFKITKKKNIRIILSVLMMMLFLTQQFVGNIFDYYAFVLLAILISCYKDYQNKSIVLLNAASLIIMFFLPLGSDFGIGNMGSSSIWLGTFLAFGHYYRSAKRGMEKNDYSIIIFLGITVLTFFSIHLYEVSKNAYFDSGSRIEKRFSIENSLATVYTTESKSKIMNELLVELDKYVVAGDTMLCFESLPTVQYLTQTTPFVGTSWVWVYDPNSFERNLLRAENSASSMPVVLRQKCQPIGGNWTTFDNRYNDTSSEDDCLYKKNRIIAFNEFLNRHNYQIAWENDLFQILTVKIE